MLPRGVVFVFARSASAHPFGTGGESERPRRSARRPCRTRRPHDAGGVPENPVRFAGEQVVECQRESPSVRLLPRRLICVRKSRRVSGGPRVAGRGDHVAVSRHQSRECLAASPRRVFRTLEDLGRNGPKRKMVGARRFELLTFCTPADLRLPYFPAVLEIHFASMDTA